jgi:hypothetical protein
MAGTRFGFGGMAERGDATAGRANGSLIPCITKEN